MLLFESYACMELVQIISLPSILISSYRLERLRFHSANSANKDVYENTNQNLAQQQGPADIVFEGLVCS